MKLKFNDSTEAYEYYYDKATTDELKSASPYFMYQIAKGRLMTSDEKIMLDQVLQSFKNLPKGFLNYAILIQSKDTKTKADNISLIDKIKFVIRLANDLNSSLNPEAFRYNLNKRVKELGTDSIEETWKKVNNNYLL